MHWSPIYYFHSKWARKCSVWHCSKHFAMIHNNDLPVQSWDFLSVVVSIGFLVPCVMQNFWCAYNNNETISNLLLLFSHQPMFGILCYNRILNTASKVMRNTLLVFFCETPVALFWSNCLLTFATHFFLISNHQFFYFNVVAPVVVVFVVLVMSVVGVNSNTRGSSCWMHLLCTYSYYFVSRHWYLLVPVAILGCSRLPLKTQCAQCTAKSVPWLGFMRDLVFPGFNICDVAGLLVVKFLIRIHMWI